MAVSALTFGLTAISIGISGCSLSGWWGSKPSAPKGTAATTTQVAPVVAVTAVPVYRLVVDPARIDRPSRLLVLHARIESLDEREPLHFNPSELRIVLPNGVTGQVFDRAQGAEILKRTDLAEGNLSYLREGTGKPHGGLPEWTKPLLRDQITRGLLQETDFDRTQPLQGYLVVDTVEPLSSLDGVVLEVTATRRGDTATTVRQSYEFAAEDSSSEVPAAGEKQ